VTPRIWKVIAAIWITTAVLIVGVLVFADRSDAHPPPPPYTGGWTANTEQTPLRPDGQPMTHRCGPIRFSILDHGNPGVAAEMRNTMWEVTLISGQQFVEVPHGQVGTYGIELRWEWPGGPIHAGWTKMRTDGWNYTLNQVYLNPGSFAGEYLAYLRPAIRHEVGHAFGMGHTQAVSIMRPLVRKDGVYTWADGAGFQYLSGHPPEPGEPCYRAW
jgi:hypothetical protein